MTIHEVIAREAIRHTIMSYTIGGDSRNAEMFAPLFADDAIFEFEAWPPLPGFYRVGREEIDPQARWDAYTATEKEHGGSSFQRHNITTCRIELTGPDTAKAHSSFIVMTDIGPDHSGFYTDDLVRQGDRWVFKHRRIKLDWRHEDSLFPFIPKPKA